MVARCPLSRLRIRQERVGQVHQHVTPDAVHGGGIDHQGQGSCCVSGGSRKQITSQMAERDLDNKSIIYKACTLAEESLVGISEHFEME